MCTGGSRHLEDFICLVLVRKIPWDANEGASHATLSKTGIFFFILVSLIHHYTHYMAADVDISIFSVLHSFKTIVTDWCVLGHICCKLYNNAHLWINNNIAQDYVMHCFLFIYYNSLEYWFLIGQLHHPTSAKYFLIFTIVHGSTVLFISPLIRILKPALFLFLSFHTKDSLSLFRQNDILN